MRAKILNVTMPRRELTSAGSTTGATNATLQVAMISTTIPLYPRRHLQHLLHATPSDLPRHAPPVPRRSDGAMAAGDSCGMNSSIRQLKARVVAVNVSTPSGQ